MGIKILSGQELVDTLRQHCDDAKERIWIASPYIGNITDVQKIIGVNWKRRHIDFRVLTDIESGFIRPDTYEAFTSSLKTEIKSLLGLHAKIYLIDDWCLLTSANLTGMAFSARHEVGQQIVSRDGISSVTDLFECWWKKSESVSDLPRSISKPLADREDSTKYKYKKLYKLPKYIDGESDSFLRKCDRFKEFAILYESTTGRNQQMVQEGFSLYQEVDYFLNYLYHDHPNRPSKRYTKEVRSLSQKKVKQEILRYFKEMGYSPGDGQWRLDRSAYIQKVLPFKKTQKPDKDKIKQILDCLHCLHSYQWNKPKIISENNLQVIAEAWNNLLASSSIKAQIIEATISSIKYFGMSSACELIAWYYPEDYPMINLNSECGLRFFGFSV